jgi:hypothetical protein
VNFKAATQGRHFHHPMAGLLATLKCVPIKD